MRAEWRRLALLLGLSLLVRIALMVAFKTYEAPSKGNHFLFAAEYGRIARSLAVGQGYADPYHLDSGGPTTLGVPFFPAYLSVLFRLFGTYSKGAAIALFVSNSVAWMVVVLLVFVVGRRLFTPGVAWLATVVASFEPTGLWYSVNSTWETAFSA